MKQERNVEGLRQNAQKKRQQAIDRTDQAVRQLLKEGRSINFKAVAEVAHVSTAWLYKEPEIKSRIEQLRQQETDKKLSITPPLQKASNTSKEAIIRTLKERIKKLETENQTLRQQNEVAYGQVLEVNTLRASVARLKSENDSLRQRLRVSEASGISATNFTTELSTLGVNLNSTLTNLIKNAPTEIVKAAIESLKEAKAKNQVQNPSGFLNKAIQDAWKPNENYERELEVEVFNQWWDLARALKLVEAAMQIDGVQHILTAEGWIPFQQMLLEYPVETLKQMKHN